MRRIFFIMLAMTLIMSTACEKTIDEISEKEVVEKETEDEIPVDSLGEDDDEDVIDKNSPISVETFLAGNFEGGAFVEGYIVGACSRHINNAEFTPPFTSKNSLLLADERGETDKEKIITVQLLAGDKRDELNLVDNENNFGKRIIIFGYQATYLYHKGMKRVGSYEFID